MSSPTSKWLARAKVGTPERSQLRELLDRDDIRRGDLGLLSYTDVKHTGMNLGTFSRLKRAEREMENEDEERIAGPQRGVVQSRSQSITNPWLFPSHLQTHATTAYQTPHQAVTHPRVPPMITQQGVGVDSRNDIYDQSFPPPHHHQANVTAMYQTPVITQQGVGADSGLPVPRSEHYHSIPPSQHPKITHQGAGVESGLPRNEQYPAQTPMTTKQGACAESGPRRNEQYHSIPPSQHPHRTEQYQSQTPAMTQQGAGVASGPRRNEQYPAQTPVITQQGVGLESVPRRNEQYQTIPPSQSPAITQRRSEQYQSIPPSQTTAITQSTGVESGPARSEQYPAQTPMIAHQGVDVESGPARSEPYQSIPPSQTTATTQQGAAMESGPARSEQYQSIPPSRHQASMYQLPHPAAVHQRVPPISQQQDGGVDSLLPTNEETTALRHEANADMLGVPPIAQQGVTDESQIDEYMAKSAGMFSSMYLDNVPTGTLTTAANIVTFYDNNIRPPGGKAFREENINVVVANFLRHDVLDTEANFHTKLSRISGLLAYIDVRNHDSPGSINLSANVHAELMKFRRFYDKNQKRAEQKKTSSFVATEKDVRHLVNSILAENQGAPISYRNVLAAWCFKFGSHNGRGKFELLTIASASFSLVRVQGITLLSYEYCHTKTRQICVSTIGGKVAILLTLCLLQHMGAIESARDVYNNAMSDEPLWNHGILVQDAETFETSEVLLQKLENAHKSLNAKLRAKLTGKLSKDGEDRQSGHLWDEMIRQEDPSDRRIPMFAKTQRNTQSICSERMKMKTIDEFLGLCGKRYGYLTSHSFRFGFQLLRRSPEQERNMIAGLKTPALCDDPDLFSSDVKPRDEPYPSNEELFELCAASPKLFRRCFCPVVGCEEGFIYVGDLHEHLGIEHTTKCMVTCPSCSKNMTVEDFKKKHVKSQSGRVQCKGDHSLNPFIGCQPKRRSKDEGPPSAACVLHCDLCDYFTYTKSQLTKHKNLKHPDEDEEFAPQGAEDEKPRARPLVKGKKQAPEKQPKVKSPPKRTPKEPPTIELLDSSDDESVLREHHRGKYRTTKKKKRFLDPEDEQDDCNVDTDIEMPSCPKKARHQL